MASNKERVFVTGATGYIGTGVVRGLIEKGVKTTAYVRDEQKAKNLFKDELKTDHLTIVAGTYTSVDVYTKAIEGHTRLFLLVADIGKPTSMNQIKGTFGKIAFEKGVRQIVDLSSSSVSISGRQGIVAYAHTTAEEKLWALAEENPERRSLVVLRPGGFMSNHFMGDVHHVKRSNKLVSCGSPSTILSWIDTKDISDCAVVILTESVEKHDRLVYGMAAEALTNKERAAVFSKVLGRPIVYEQQSLDDFYKHYIDFGMPHGVVYNFASYYMNNIGATTTLELAIVLGRQLRTLEEWLRENAQAFQ